MNKNVDWYFEQEEKWKEAIAHLRKIVLSTGLSEVLKWGCPCYTFEEKNIVLIHVFKDYCALLFFKGALLNDKDGLLIQQTKNVQVARQMRFDSLNQVKKLKTDIKQFIYQAIEAEKAGWRVALKKTDEFEMVAEFKNKLKEVTGLKAAFESLTPGRQRGYLLYFSQAKQEKTRISRIVKSIPAIFDGKGLND